MEILTTFPLLIPQNKDRTHYSGYIEIKGHSFYLDIRLTSADTSLDGSSIYCGWKLQDVLRDYLPLLVKRLKQSSKLVDFLHEFKRIVELQLENQPAPDTCSSAKLYDGLVTQIENIGWQRLVFVDSSFTQLHLVTEDGKQRKHLLKVYLRNDHPQTAPRCVVSLPKAFNFAWTKKSTLKDLLDQFNLNLDQYQDLWDNLDLIDEKTWIQEPEKPTREDLYRRIALGNNASLQLTFDPDHPRMFPECRFLGADHVINPLKTKLNVNVHKWDMDQTVLQNLLDILEIEFPYPTESSKQELSTECGICYAYRLGDELPDQACDDPRCGQPYHQSCLYEWLRALPSFRQSFNIAFGECPYCSTPITVKTTR